MGNILIGSSIGFKLDMGNIYYSFIFKFVYDVISYTLLTTTPPEFMELRIPECWTYNQYISTVGEWFAIIEEQITKYENHPNEGQYEWPIHPGPLDGVHGDQRWTQQYDAEEVQVVDVLGDGHSEGRKEGTQSGNVERVACTTCADCCRLTQRR